MKLLPHAMVLLIALAGGCDSAVPGTRRVLGPIAYDKAFETSCKVMGEYFTLAESDRRTGTIKSRPRLVEAGRFSISSPMPARQVAGLRLRADGQYVIAHLSIAVQQQGSEMRKRLSMEEENHGHSPYRSPALFEGATTPEQNQIWEVIRYDHPLEREILNQIARSLQPSEQAADQAGGRPGSADVPE